MEGRVESRLRLVSWLLAPAHPRGVPRDADLAVARAPQLGGHRLAVDADPDAVVRAVRGLDVARAHPAAVDHGVVVHGSRDGVRLPAVGHRVEELARRARHRRRVRRGRRLDHRGGGRDRLPWPRPRPVPDVHGLAAERHQDEPSEGGDEGEGDDRRAPDAQSPLGPPVDRGLDRVVVPPRRRLAGGEGSVPVAVVRVLRLVGLEHRDHDRGGPGGRSAAALDDDRRLLHVGQGRRAELLRRRRDADVEDLVDVRASRPVPGRRLRRREVRFREQVVEVLVGRLRRRGRAVAEVLHAAGPRGAEVLPHVRGVLVLVVGRRDGAPRVRGRGACAAEDGGLVLRDGDRGGGLARSRGGHGDRRRDRIGVAGRARCEAGPGCRRARVVRRRLRAGAAHRAALRGARRRHVRGRQAGPDEGPLAGVVRARRPRGGRRRGRLGGHELLARRRAVVLSRPGRRRLVVLLRHWPTPPWAFPIQGVLRETV